jgi:N-acetylglucosaminyldiphosphoundecaprenol N-acetyl-beta-D-mannosaminyltransferase
MLHLLEAAEKNTVPVGFYGGSSIGLKRLIMRLRERYPRLQIAFEMSPPFRELSVEEDDQVVRDIASSGARLLFVGLGCPKQEKWITSHAGRVHAVMFGVGAAFDFIAGTKPQAPRWMMRIGFEWCFRLASEPRRLTKRYLKHNPRFVAYFLGQLLAEHAPLIFGGGSN